ncbi:MAG: YbaK/EbsC family protein [Anaerolineae bacterium]
MSVHGGIEEILEGSGVPYQVHFHEEMPFPIRSPDDFARALGYDVARITKTMLLRATDRQEFCLVVLSSEGSMDLEKVAGLMNAKRVQMASREELARTLGYPASGVSPISAGSPPVFLDQGIMDFPTVLIGGGEVGVEIEISPRALQHMTDGEVVSIAV